MAGKLALIAHDGKKAALAAWVGRHMTFVTQFAIVATGTTGSVIADAYPTLEVERLASGPLGGDQQIGARIVEGAIAGIVFFVDPLTPMPHDVDVKALMRLAIVYDIPLALNEASATLLIRELS